MEYQISLGDSIMTRLFAPAPSSSRLSSWFSDRAAYFGIAAVVAGMFLMASMIGFAFHGA